MARFYVERQNWQHWPKTLVVVRKRDFGGRDVRSYRPVRTCHATTVFEYMTGCSVCGCPWDWFYQMGNFQGPPNFCPKCGCEVEKGGCE